MKTLYKLGRKINKLVDDAESLRAEILVSAFRINIGCLPSPVQLFMATKRTPNAMSFKCLEIV